MKKFIYSFLLINILFLAFNVEAKCNLNIQITKGDINKNKEISLDARTGTDFCTGGVTWTLKDSDGIVTFEGEKTRVTKNGAGDNVKLLLNTPPKYDKTVTVCVSKENDSSEVCKGISINGEYVEVGDKLGYKYYCKRGDYFDCKGNVCKCYKYSIAQTVAVDGKDYCKNNTSPIFFKDSEGIVKNICLEEEYPAEKTESPSTAPNANFKCGAGFVQMESSEDKTICCPEDAAYLISENNKEYCAKITGDFKASDLTCPRGQIQKNNSCYQKYSEVSVADKDGFRQGDLLNSNTIPSQSDYEINSKTDYKGDQINVCKTKQVIDSMKKINVVLDLIKLLAPIILVLVSTLSLSKEVTSFDDPDTKKYIKEFIIKFVLCVMIYFLPTALSYLFSATTKASDEGGYSSCIACALNDEKCPIDFVCFDEKGKSTPCPTEYGAGDCESILGNPTDENSVAYYAQIALNVIKYVGILLCIILSSLDIIKAIMGNDKDAHKPVVEKTIKRFMYAAILFFVPSLVNALFTILGLFSSCGIK